MTAIPKLRAVPSGSWRATRQRYLQWFKPTNSWRFRRVVPKHLKAVIGKGEWTETLQARTEAEGIRLVLPHIEKTDRIIALASAGNWPAVPDEDVHDLAFAWWTGEPGVQTLSSGEIARSVERFLIGPRKLGGWLENSPMLERTRERVLAILDNPDRNAAIRRNPDAMGRLLHECRRYRAIHALQNGSVQPFDVVTPAGESETQAVMVRLDPANGSARVFPPLSLGAEQATDKLDLISRWAKEHDIGDRGVYQARLDMVKFVAVIGHGEATRVTRNDVIGFKEHLSGKGLSSPTINRYLSAVKSPLRWAFENDKIGTNPGLGIVYGRKPKGETKRIGYDDQQARTILMSARDEDLPHRRWIPWVCAFAGTRLDEVAGRNVHDIEKVGLYWVLTIPFGKTPGSARKVPLHPVLIREGFLDYVDGLPTNGPLFPDLTPDRFGRRAGSATKRIGDWLRRLQKETGILLVEKNRYAPNHSWRHRFISEARRVRMEEEVHDALTGHREGTASRDYGEFYIDTVLGPAIKSMLSPLDLIDSAASL